MTGGDAVRLVTLTGAEAAAFVPHLARLRIVVFREFPYLYDGSEAYERRYLEHWIGSEDSVVVAALAGDRVIGASTALPLRHEPAFVTAPFRDHGWDVSRLFYYGESVLLPGWRGQGLGAGFFRRREDHARRLGTFSHAVFCTVDRPANHPRRPPGYTPLDGFWCRRGFQPLPEITCSFSWQDLDESSESPKLMRFWIKDLRL